MSRAYIPRKDEEARAWFEAFAKGISMAPGAFMLTSAQAASIQGVVDQFVQALSRASSELTRSKRTVLQKDDARSIAESMCRQYASLIKLNAGICDANKIAIGVRPLNRSRRRNNCPQSCPALGIVGSTTGRQYLRYKDSISETSAKPFGATSLELRVALTGGSVGTLSEAKPAGLFTRNPITIEFTQDDDAKRATYYGRWVSRRGETGPWSLPVSMTVAA